VEVAIPYPSSKSVVIGSLMTLPMAYPSPCSFSP
jgi:hypothetical protein